MSSKKTATLPPIAIVGIAAELPSGLVSKHNLDHDGFFKFLLDGSQSYEPIPKTRFNKDFRQGTGPGQTISKTGTFLKDVLLFDHVEFGITPKDAKSMAVSTRKLIEHSFLALLDSGIDYRGKNIGCFTSGVGFDTFSIADYNDSDAAGSFAGAPSMLANKVSYYLDLTGPSVPTDTACSSSLTALHLAIQSIRAGDCIAAVVGGCQINQRYIDFVQYTQGGILSQDGKCKPFDASADGFGRGEGAVAIVIKSLEAAVRDKDHIYASILGTAINSCGSAAPVYAPVADAQAEAMHRAYLGTGRSPSEVDYIELHATGTAAGDPVEANWTGHCFQRDDDLLIGSVKGNIGHLEIAAFLASLSKVCSMLATGLVPPNANLNNLNPAIHWSKYRLRVPREVVPLPTRNLSGRPLISVSSSGIGGANGHAVLEGPPIPHKCSTSSGMLDQPVLLVSGGLSPRSCNAVSSGILNVLEDPSVDPRMVSVVYGRRSRGLTWRTYHVHLPGSSLPPNFQQAMLVPRVKPPIVFVFSGQGPQNIEMGRQLFHTFPGFKDTILAMDRIHQRCQGFSLIEHTGLFLRSDSAIELPDVWPINIILPSIVMIQVALYNLFSSVGVVPDVLIGHSAGETAVMYASGAASAEMTMEIAIARGEALRLCEEKDGSMVALACSVQNASHIIARVLAQTPSEILEIACHNAQGAVTLSGSTGAADHALDIAKAEGIFAVKLRTPVAMHSAQTEKCYSKYIDSMNDVFTRFPGDHTPQTPVYSTLTGGAFQSTFNPEYFWRNARQPVLFTEAITAMLKEMPMATFVEIGPHPVLSSYLVSLGANSSSVICPMKRSKGSDTHHEVTVFLDSIGRLATLGYNCIDFQALNGVDYVDKALTLPLYPFVSKEISYFSESSQIMAKQMALRNGPLNYPGLKINAQTHPILSHHVIRDECIMPAAGYIEMAFEFGAKTLWNVSFRSLLPLHQDHAMEISVTSNKHYFSVSSKQSFKTRVHADGFMSRQLHPSVLKGIDLEEVRSRCHMHDISDFYHSLNVFAQYGPAFRRITKYYHGRDECLVEIRGMDNDLLQEDGYIIHPAILDACLHAIIHPSFSGNLDPNIYYLPSAVESVFLADVVVIEKTVFAHCCFRTWKPDGLIVDITITNPSGQCVCILSALEVAAHPMTVPMSPERSFTLIHQPLAMPPLSSLYVPGFLRSKIIEDFQSCQNTSLLEGYSDLVRLLLLHAIQVGKKVIYILDTGNNKVLFDRIQPIFVDHPQIQIVYVLEADPTCIPQCKYSNIHLRRYLNAADPRFDIILASRPFAGDPKPTLTSFRPLLSVGGYVITFESARSPNHLSAFREDAYSDSHTSQPHSFQDWCELMHQTGFSLTPHLGTDVTFILMAQIAAFPKNPCHNNDSPKNSITRILSLRSIPEIDLQGHLGSYDEGVLWVASTSDASKAAARGLIRSLRKELGRDIRLIQFDAAWDIQACHSFIHQLTAFSCVENEMVVTHDGTVMVPRVVPLIAMQAEGNHGPILQIGAKTCTPPPKQGHILVEVLSSIDLKCGLFGIVGQPIDGSTGTWASPVIGVVLNQEISTHLSLHLGSVVPLPPNVGHNWILSSLGAILVLMIATPSLMSHTERFGQARFVVTHREYAIGHALHMVLESLGLQHQTLDSSMTVSDFEKIRASDILFTGFEEEERQIIESLTQPTCSSFFWNDSSSGLNAVLSKNPWIFSDNAASIINALCFEAAVAEASLSSISTIISHAGKIDEPIVVPPMFDPNRVYLLVGGIGLLGIRIALWMYQKNARNIVLTSRSGRESIIRQGVTSSIRMLQFLERQDNLNLRLEACDASSQVSMKCLLSSIDIPIAGCMLLSTVVSDRLFSAHSKESFNAALIPKIEAFKILELVHPIKELDFLVAFSSAAAFGNAGQTAYASANTGLEDLLRPYRNAFSIQAPMVRETLAAAGDQGTSVAVEGGIQMNSIWESWAMSSSQICSHIERGLLLLRQQPFDIYIPDFDWHNMRQDFGASPIYEHLVEYPHKVTLAPELKLDADTLQEIVLRFVDVEEPDFEPSVPLVGYGLDSMSASRLSVALKPHITLTQLQLLADISLLDIQRRIGASREEALAPSNLDTSLVDAMISKYSRKLPPTFLVPNASGTPATILITGTTGHFGSQLLARLIDNKDVAAIYALNRKAEQSLLERHRTRFETMRLNSTLLESNKLMLLEGDLGLGGLGLPTELYEKLSRTTTTIIHNAWPLDLNSALPAFEKHIAGTKHLIDFVHGQKYQARFIFISTIDAARSWDRTKGGVPEDYIRSADCLGSGYGEAKFIAGQILAESGLRTTQVRVGQICGGETGVWAINEWVPALFKSSLALGALPATKSGADEISWIHGHIAAQGIIDIVFSQSAPPVLNLVHPRPSSWMKVIQDMRGALIQAKGLKDDILPIISFPEWYSRLEDRAVNATSDELKDIPALRLLEFFRELTHSIENNPTSVPLGLLPRFETKQMEHISPLVANTTQLTSDDTRGWIGCWIKAGFL